MMIVRGRPLLWGPALVLGLCLFPGSVFAHAHLVRADLTPDGHLVVPAGTYHFWFDESLNPTLSRIVIDDAAGKQVNQDTGKLNAANAEELDVQVPALAAGKYSVLWTSDSAQDGHILHGFYLFTAGGAGAKAISTTPPAPIAAAQPTLDSTALVGALAHWLVLLASTLWTGALALELLVLAPFRKRRRTHHRSLADEASSSIIRIVQVGLAASVITSLLELEVQAYGAGGWSGTVSGSVLQDTLSSHYGTYWIVRVVCTVLALIITPPRRGKAQDPLLDQGNRAARRAFQRFASTLRPANLWPLGLIGLVYLLAIAESGHAAAVSQLLVTSVLLDWLHLLANAVWVGGMAAIALALIPAMFRYAARGPRYALVGREEFLTLLDRYSPAAFIAVATAGFTGMFNAQVHLSSFDQLINTTYGRFLLIKLFLIAEIMLLSASHVFVTRPRLRALAGSRALGMRAEELFTSLISRLRIEPLIGTLILLCVALMGQVAPGVTVFTAPTAASTATPTASASPTSEIQTTPASIQGSVHKGLLDVTLTITPPALGQAKFFATVRERGKPVTDGQVRIRLSVPANTSLGDHFVETTPTKGGYQGSGDLVLDGRWLADVLVRTHSDPNEFRDVPFDFVAGPSAMFLVLPATTNAFGPATVSLGQPANAPAVLSVRLSAGLQVRVEVAMLGMAGMAPEYYPATAASGGSYHASIIFPMAGVTRIIVQVQKAGAWQTARLLIYEVDVKNVAHLLVQSAVSAPNTSAASSAVAAPSALATPAGQTAQTTAALDQPGSVQLAISVKPGRINAPNTFTLGGIQQASAVRILSQSLDMAMGVIPYPAQPLGGGQWRVSNAFAPMNGRWGVTIQAQRDGAWATLRQVTYYVPLSGIMRLLTSQTGANPAGLPAPSADLSKAYHLDLARSLPYTVLVTEMGSNGVRKLFGPILHTGLQAHGVDVLDGTPYAYVTNFGADPGTVTQIDLRTMHVVRTFSVGLGPAHVVFTPDKQRAFVTDFRSSDLYVLNLVTGASRPIEFPNGNCFEPHGIDISEDGSTLYVACAGGAWIYTVNTNTLKPGRAVITAPGAYGVAVDGPRHEVWVTNQTSNDVTVIDERTLRVTATIKVGKGPALLVATPNGRQVYVADQLGNQVSVIDAESRKVIATLPVAAQPHGPDVTADGKYVYVASIGGNAVTIIRTADQRVVAVVPAPVGSNEAAVDNGA